VNIDEEEEEEEEEEEVRYNQGVKCLFNTKSLLLD